MDFANSPVASGSRESYRSGDVQVSTGKFRQWTGIHLLTSFTVSDLFGVLAQAPSKPLTNELKQHCN
jgi:hypothetical protein